MSPTVSAGSAASAGLTATSNLNVLPLPGRLCTVMLPPISSTSRRQIAKPRPLPPNRREIEPSIWVNSWNI